MKILDKNKDFYDYLQYSYPDKTFTFDRTDSFTLTKQMLSEYLTDTWRNSVGDRRFLLLQVCNTFWLFVAEVLSTDSYDNIKDFSVDLLSTWKNYNRPRCPYRLEVIKFPWHIEYQVRVSTYMKDTLKETVPKLVTIIDNGEYKVSHCINKHKIRRDDGVIYEKHIPLLKESGLSKFIAPMDIYLSLEEYFSLERTASERTESVGITDIEKIENHGFNKKTSFRGKTNK